jgi:hypothetical protein
MATRGDVMNERRRYQWIRLVLLWIFLLSLLGWLIYGDVWSLFNPKSRALLYSGSTFFQGILTTLHWFFCVDFLPFCAVGFAKNYWLYATLFSGFMLWFYLRKVASFNCPYCDELIEVDTSWQCPHCRRAWTRPFWYTIFHKCKFRKCRRKQKYFRCTNGDCRQVIYIMSPAPQVPSVQPPANVARFPGTGTGP